MKMNPYNNYQDMFPAGDGIASPDNGDAGTESHGTTTHDSAEESRQPDDTAPQVPMESFRNDPSVVNSTQSLNRGFPRSPYTYDPPNLTGESSFGLFTGTFPVWTNSTVLGETPGGSDSQQSVQNWSRLGYGNQSPAPSPFGNFHLSRDVEVSSERRINQDFAYSGYPEFVPPPYTQAILNWQETVEYGLPMTYNEPSTTSRSETSATSTNTQEGTTPPIVQPIPGANVSANPARVAAGQARARASRDRKIRERQARALRRSVAHARAHTLAPSPGTSLATSPGSQVENSVRARKVSKAKKREEKIQCGLCSTELSGEHEFARHFKLVHASEGWRWQVIDPFEKGLVPQHPVPFAISQCRNCQSGKLYGINYNAAAHIRRVHFKNTPNINGGSKGGSSGGAWPEIRYLEYFYMKLVHVQVNDSHKTPGRTAKEGINYSRTGLEQATPYRETSSKRHSSVPASDFSHTEGQASHCNSFMMKTPGIGLSPSGDEHVCVTPYTVESATAWPGHAFHPQGIGFDPNDSAYGSHVLL